MNTALVITVIALGLGLSFALTAGVLGAFRRFLNNWRDAYREARLPVRVPPAVTLSDVAFDEHDELSYGLDPDGPH